MTTFSSKVRNVIVRGIAVTAVVMTYAAGSIATHVIGAAGLSGLMLSTSSTPADAQWWRGRRHFRRWHFFRRWRGWRR